jgi:Protein of unknown function (DUF5132)
MAASVVYFLLGLGTAWALPILSRVARPLAVEAAAAGMGMVDEARRLVAEQVETLEDIAAEARARREAIQGSAFIDLHGPGNGDAPDSDEPVATTRARRRGESTGRSRAS